MNSIKSARVSAASRGVWSCTVQACSGLGGPSCTSNVHLDSAAAVKKAGQRDNNPVKLSTVYDRGSGLRVRLLVELAGVQEQFLSGARPSELRRVRGQRQGAISASTMSGLTPRWRRTASRSLPAWGRSRKSRLCTASSRAPPWRFRNPARRHPLGLAPAPLRLAAASVLPGGARSRASAPSRVAGASRAAAVADLATT